jgi:hypothetical protein
MMNSRLRLIIVMLCLTAGISLAQSTKFYASIVPDKHGAFYVFSSDARALTAKVDADSIWPTKQRGTIVADKNILQVISIPSESNEDTSEASVKRLLLDHMSSELKYVKEEYKQDLSHPSSEFLVLNGRLFLYWDYDMPNDNQSVATQLYFTTVCFDQIVVFNAPVSKSIPKQSVKQFLASVAKTLKTYQTPIDPNAYYQELMK